MPITTAFISTPDGTFRAEYSPQGLARLCFPGEPDSDIPADSGTSPLSRELRRWQALTRAALLEALRGRPPGVLPPLDLSSGTAFQQKVWHALRKIGCRRTMTYGRIAAVIKKPKAARAVGAACGANPIPIFIPCHRVLPGSGGLGGFSAGLPWKRKLLAREGILLAGDKL